jgi:hypothetical protein
VKNIILAALLACFGAVAAPPAQASGGTATDCTAGCMLYTCDGSTCTLWYCSGGSGCNPIGTFTRPKSLLEKAGGNDLAYAKVCPTKTACDVYELSVSKAAKVGTFDNVEGIIELLQQGEAAQGGRSPKG